MNFDLMLLFWLRLRYTGPSEAGGQGGQLPPPPTFAKNGAKVVNNGQILAEIWFLPTHFWGLTPHFSVAFESPEIISSRGVW